jgi:hypothetical protein
MRIDEMPVESLTVTGDLIREGTVGKKKRKRKK